MVIGTVIEKVRAVLEAEPFLFHATSDPFDFHHQPMVSLDNAYRVQARMNRREGMVGPYVTEHWDIDIWIARRFRGKMVAAHSALMADLSALGLAVVNASMSDGSYYVSSEHQEEEMPVPGGEQEYLIAYLRAVVEFDRALSEAGGA